MKAKLSIIAGFAVSAVLLWLALRNIEFASLAGIYSKADPVYLAPAVCLILLGLCLRGARWRLLLLPSNPKVRFLDAFKLQAAGLALNNILPMRMGELARATFAASLFKIPLLTVLATILVERLVDIIVLFVMFIAAARLGGITGGFLEYGGVLWTLAAGVTAGIAALIFAEEIAAHAWFAGFFRRFPRLRTLFERVAMGVEGFHSFRGGALILSIAALQWFCDAVVFLLLGRAFGLGGVIDIFKGVALVFAGAAAASVPGMPGYFGNYELVLVKVMAAWGVAEDTGFAYVSCAHVLGYLVVTLLGVFFIYQMGQSVGRVWSDFSAAARRKG